MHILDTRATLSSQSISNAHRDPLKRVGRGVLLGFGIALCFMPNADSSNMSDIKMTPKQYAYYSLNDLKEYKCIASLYGKESAWNYNAANGSHYGIPQGNSIYLLTANPYEQIDWGIDYIHNRYGSMCKAWEHWQRYGWH